MYLLLPGSLEGSDLLETFEESNANTYSDMTCTLTLCGMLSCDVKNFFQERLETSQSHSTHTIPFFETQEEHLFRAVTQDLQDLDVANVPKCIRLSGCGHVFSGAPLLYELIVNSFRCPLCRHGSNQNINILHPGTVPNNMDPHLWRILCFLGRRARKLGPTDETDTRGIVFLPQDIANRGEQVIFMVVENLVDTVADGLSATLSQ